MVVYDVSRHCGLYRLKPIRFEAVGKKLLLDRSLQIAVNRERQWHVFAADLSKKVRSA